MRTRQIKLSDFVKDQQMLAYLRVVDAQTTYVPKTLTVNGKTLDNNISITAADLGALTTQLQGDWNQADNTKADYVKNKPAIPKVYNGNTVVTNPINVVGSTTTTGGVAVFNLTDDGTANGNALFTNVFYNKAEVSDAADSYNYAYLLSGNKKVLTVTVTRSAPTGVIGLLGLNILSAPVATPNGTIVNVLVSGN